MTTTTETRPEQQAPATPFHKLGGHAVIQAIVNRFYDLMESDPAYAELRAMHAPDLAPMRASLASFLAAWAGGPRDWFEQRPGACIMSAHNKLATPVTKPTADQWMDAMGQAIDAQLTDAALGTAMKDALRGMSMGMIRA